jgi:hypothetical protein
VDSESNGSVGEMMSYSVGDAVNDGDGDGDGVGGGIIRGRSWSRSGDGGLLRMVVVCMRDGTRGCRIL